MVSVPVISLNRTDTYSSIWLKYVRAVDLTVRCINCLVGDRATIQLRAERQSIPLNEYTTPLAWYLCGVSSPYRWSANAHLAFEPAPGEHWHGPALVPGLTVTLLHARPITGWGEHSIPADSPCRWNHDFRMCRNYQFAHHLAHAKGIASVDNPDKYRYRSRPSSDDDLRLL